MTFREMADEGLVSQVWPGLWVGVEQAAYKCPKEFDIICVLEGLPMREPADAEHVPIMVAGVARPERLEQVAGLIDRSLAKGRQVYLHCAAGVERSPLCAAWWLVSRQRLTWDAAYERLWEVRPIVADRRNWLPCNPSPSPSRT